MRSALASRAGNEHAVHEKGSVETDQGQDARVAPGARQPVGGVRAVYRLDDAACGYSHAIARKLSRPGEDAAADFPDGVFGYFRHATDTVRGVGTFDSG